MSATYIQRGMTSQFAARYLLADVSELAETAKKKHQLTAKAGKLIAESIAASVLMSSQIKGKERLTIQIEGSRPKFAFICDISADGSVRAKLSPQNALRPKDGAINGLMLAIKHNDRKELYRGITPIEHSKIDSALEAHLRNSSQIDVAVRIIVDQDEQGVINRAIGILIERLPPAKDLPALNSDEFNERYSPLRKMKVKELIEEIDRSNVIGQDLHDMETRKLFWKCTCSEAQIRSMLFSLGPDELREIINEEGDAKVNCHFCNTNYVVGTAELEELITQHQENYN